MRLTRMIALVTACWMLLPHLQWAFAETTYAPPADASLPSDAPPPSVSSLLLSIPPALGTIASQWTPAPGKTSRPGLLVVHIQDLHCHAEAQKRIADLLAYLARVNGLVLVGVEGSAGALDVGKLAAFPDAGAKSEIGLALLRQGRLSGPEFAAAAGPATLRLEGVENAALYAASESCLDQFLSEESQGTIADLRDALESLKAREFNPNLADLDRQRSAFLRGNLDGLAYAEWLKRAARQAPGLEPDALQTALGLRAPDGPENEEAFLAQAETVDQALRLRWFQRDFERQLDAAGRFLETAEKLLAISATARELRWFRHQPWERSWQELQNLWTEAQTGLGAELPAARRALEAADRFYRLADQRSDYLADNLAAAAQGQGVRLAALVTGGYHTEQVLARLRAHGIAYASIRPRLTRWEDPSPYYSLLRRTPGPLDRFLGGQSGAFAPASLFPTGPAESSAADENLPEPKRSQALRLDLGLKLAALWSLARRWGAWDPDRVKRAFRGLVSRYPRNNPRLVPRLDAARQDATSLAVPFQIGDSQLWAVLEPQTQAESPAAEPALEEMRGPGLRIRLLGRQPALASWARRRAEVAARLRAWWGQTLRQALDLAWSAALMAPSLAQPLLLFGLLWLAPFDDYSVPLAAAGLFPIASLKPERPFQPPVLKPGLLFRLPRQGVFIITRVTASPDRVEFKSISGQGQSVVRPSTWFYNQPGLVFFPEHSASSRWINWGAYALFLLIIAWMLVSWIFERPQISQNQRQETEVQTQAPAQAPRQATAPREPETLRIAPRLPAELQPLVSCPALPDSLLSRENLTGQFFPVEYVMLRDLFAVLCNLNALSPDRTRKGLSLIARIDGAINQVNFEPDWEQHRGLLELTQRSYAVEIQPEEPNPALDELYAVLAKSIGQLRELVTTANAGTEMAQVNQERREAVRQLQREENEINDAEYKRLNQELTDRINDLRSQGIEDAYIADLLGLKGIARNLFLTLGYILDGLENNQAQWRQAVAYLYEQRTRRHYPGSEQFWPDVNRLAEIVLNPRATPEQLQEIKMELDLFFTEVSFGYWKTPDNQSSLPTAPGRQRAWNSLGAVSLPFVTGLAALFTAWFGLALPLGLWAGLGLPLSLAAGLVLGGALVGAWWSALKRVDAREGKGLQTAVLLPKAPWLVRAGGALSGWRRLPGGWWNRHRLRMPFKLRSVDQAI
ncbi:MAG: hypothetical protein AB1439_06115 [candidate division FCPU426 bacterium]